MSNKINWLVKDKESKKGSTWLFSHKVAIFSLSIIFLHKYFFY